MPARHHLISSFAILILVVHLFACSVENRQSTHPTASEDPLLVFQNETPDAGLKFVGEIPNLDFSSPESLSKGLRGKWASACRDMSFSGLKDEWERLVVALGSEEMKLYLYRFRGEGGCTRRAFVNVESRDFSTRISDGRLEREQALALDLLDSSLKIEIPKASLALHVIPVQQSETLRIILEIFDGQRLGIRFAIEDWIPFLKGHLCCHERSFEELKSLDLPEDSPRRIPYTKSQALSRLP